MRIAFDDLLFPNALSSSSSSSFSLAQGSDGGPASLLVTDSIEADGRFMLYALAKHVLTPPSAASMKKQNEATRKGRGGRVLWLAGGAYTESLILNSLRKMGWESRQSIRESGNNNNESALEVRCVPLEVADYMRKNRNLSSMASVESFVKEELYPYIRSWLRKGEESGVCSWVLLDDVSSLAGLLGEGLCYGLVASLHALSFHPQDKCNDDNTNACRKRRFGLAVRSAVDSHAMVTTSNYEEQSALDWMGAGGARMQAFSARPSSASYCWESSLVELADCIVDCQPLAQGPSREVHGRIVVTVCNSKSSSNTPIRGRNRTAWSSPLIANYALSDQQVWAITLQNKPD